MSTYSALRRTGVRTAAVAAASTLVLVAVAPAASAHVTVSSPDAKAGGYAKLVFRVPTESETASTTKLVVTLPKDHPFASVGAQVKPGWTVAKAERNLAIPITSGDTTLSKAVATVTWTATAGGVPAHDFDEFALSVGRLPEGVDSLSFPAEQTYSDGKVVKWDEPTSDTGEKPKHPAPALALAPAAAVTGNDDEGGGSDVVARSLGAAGLVLGAAGLVLGLRRRTAEPAR